MILQSYILYVFYTSHTLLARVDLCHIVCALALHCFYNLYQLGSMSSTSYEFINHAHA